MTSERIKAYQCVRSGWRLGQEDAEQRQPQRYVSIFIHYDSGSSGVRTGMDGLSVEGQRGPGGSGRGAIIYLTNMGAGASQMGKELDQCPEADKC